MILRSGKIIYNSNNEIFEYTKFMLNNLSLETNIDIKLKIIYNIFLYFTNNKVVSFIKNDNSVNPSAVIMKALLIENKLTDYTQCVYYNKILKIINKVKTLY